MLNIFLHLDTFIILAIRNLPENKKSIQIYFSVYNNKTLKQLH